MSVGASSLPCVTRPTLDTLLRECAERGVCVRWGHLPGEMAGCYDHSQSTIWLREGDPEWVSVPALMHELEHAWRGDDGHQSDAVEARIDLAVARQLVSVNALEEAEYEVGPWPIAEELGVPVWVVQALQATLDPWD